MTEKSKERMYVLIHTGLSVFIGMVIGFSLGCGA